MKVIVSHPTGNQNVRAAVMGFAEAGIVHSFHTTLATFHGGLVDRLGDWKLFSGLHRRRFDPRIKAITETRPWLEVGRLMALKAGLRQLTKHETGLFSIDAVYGDLDRKIARHLGAYARRGVTAAYAYEDGACRTFQAAKNNGVQCFYDLPIGYWRAGHEILEVEKARWPAFASTLTGLQNSEEKLSRKDEELWLADRVYVASEFTASTLLRYPGMLPPIEVIPYGFPPVAEERAFHASQENVPLKLLFVGGLTQRKGIADLFAAIRPLQGHVALTLIGKKTNHACAALDAELVNHRWIESLPHHDILREMQRHDVLVFPSHFEGFGLVITEAMSQGLPVITTDHTAGPDMIVHGKNGWVLPAGDIDGLESLIAELLCQREMILECGRAAMETARSRPWEVYGRALAQSIMKQMTDADTDTSERNHSCEV